MHFVGINIIILMFLFLMPLYDTHVFPKNFIFGAGTAAFQIEGAWNISDKGSNIWDDCIHSHPDRVLDRTNGDIVADSYHFYKDDVAALKNMGVQMYRFSISWSRLLPTGFIGKKSEDGKIYYNNLINELISNGIEPMVTLYHFDLPEVLQRIGGTTNKAFVDIFVDYARYAFALFGDRVKYWITFNEPVLDCVAYHGAHAGAPGLNMPDIVPYLCVHNILLAHGHTYKMYNDVFKDNQKGYIGIANHVLGYELQSNSVSDILAAELAQEYYNGWIMNPIYSDDGDYPPLLKQAIRKRSKLLNYRRSPLPELKSEEIDLLKGSADFFGINHYQTTLFSFEKPSKSENFHIDETLGLYSYQPKYWKKDTDVIPYVSYPKGLRGVLKYIKEKYNNPPIFITENGKPNFSDENDLNDTERINYFIDYLTVLLESIHEDKVNVLGYIAWSLIDSMEWFSGLSIAFGLHKINFTSPTKERLRRKSSFIYENIIKTRVITKGNI